MPRPDWKLTGGGVMATGDEVFCNAGAVGGMGADVGRICLMLAIRSNVLWSGLGGLVDPVT